ncbi:hypothetical protein HZH66_002365 [Vespula vulgaris]|uniref:Uncharacterized protein n=1 Tax=Vespula vulgaris TaxID=7454 RepID=A0A834KJR3_VESVU|nr:hypothetical protein HZH66_002365 [Vespula vulgaris]
MDLKIEENKINDGHPKLYFHAKKKKLGRSDFPSTKSTHELFSPLSSRITIELVIYTSQAADSPCWCMAQEHSSIDLSTTKSHSSSLPTRSEKKSSVELHLRANPDKTLRPCGKQK